MKLVTFAGNSRVQVEDAPIPEPGPGEVLVKIGASAICGSEMKSYRYGEPWAGNPGHEMVGEVVETRAENGPRTGERVAINIITGCGQCAACQRGDRRFCPDQGYIFNGHAEFVAVPAVNCMSLPDDVPYDTGVLIGGDTMGVAYHAVSKLGDRSRETVAVVGCGPVGLGFVRLLSFQGSRVIAAEVSPYRQELARRAGAAQVIDPGDGDGLAALREAAGGAVDLGIDASGSDAGVNLALDAVRDEGTFIFGGAGRKATINPWSQFLEKELVAYGVWYFVDRDYEGLLDLYRQGLPVADLITHRFALDDAAQAYDLFDRAEAGKVVFMADCAHA